MPELTRQTPADRLREIASEIQQWHALAAVDLRRIAGMLDQSVEGHCYGSGATIPGFPELLGFGISVPHGQFVEAALRIGGRRVRIVPLDGPGVPQDGRMDT